MGFFHLAVTKYFLIIKYNVRAETRERKTNYEIIRKFRGVPRGGILYYIRRSEA